MVTRKEIVFGISEAVHNNMMDLCKTLLRGNYIDFADMQRRASALKWLHKKWCLKATFVEVFGHTEKPEWTAGFDYEDD